MLRLALRRPLLHVLRRPRVLRGPEHDRRRHPRELCTLEEVDGQLTLALALTLTLTLTLTRRSRW